MDDPADREVHRPEGNDPYPTPIKGAKTEPRPADDMADPGDRDSAMPHDRGVTDGDEHVGAREDMIDHVSEDREAWKQGRTQNLPPPPD